MEGIIELNHYYQRSKERVKDLGEVFTPDDYVEQMLQLLAQNQKFSWDNEQTIFFEPCCGHGNIVLAIFIKRLEAIFKKASRNNSKTWAAYYAVSNAINSIWAIDIDEVNITECRSRLFRESLHFLIKKTNLKNIRNLLAKDKNFIAHLICAIKWHIHENEMLSAMTNNKNLSESCAKKTKVSRVWLAENKHKPLNFELTWVVQFKNKIQKNSVPTLFKRAIKFVDTPNTGLDIKNNPFDFAEILLVKNFTPIQGMACEEIWNRI